MQEPPCSHWPSAEISFWLMAASRFFPVSANQQSATSSQHSRSLQPLPCTQECLSDQFHFEVMLLICFESAWELKKCSIKITHAP